MTVDLYTYQADLMVLYMLLSGAGITTGVLLIIFLRVMRIW